MFDPSVHLSGVSDVQANALVDPTCFSVHIKSSATEQCIFRGLCHLLGPGGTSYLPGDRLELGSFLAILCLFTIQRLSCLVQSLLHSARYHGSYPGHS